MASDSTFEAVNQKLVHFVEEIKTLESDIHHLWFYIRPDPAEINNVEFKIANLFDQFAEIKPELELLKSSDLGQMLVDLVREQEVKLEKEIGEIGNIREGLHEWCTADWCISRLIEKFSSIGLAVKELDDNVTLNPTAPQPLVRVLEARQKEARTELQRLVDRLSSPEHSTLFDEFNRAVLNLWDISHAIEKKLSKLTGIPIVQQPAAQPPAATNILNTINHLSNLNSLTNLREGILKALDEKQLAKTILTYVVALEAHAEIHSSMETDRRQKWNEQYDTGLELGKFRKYLERYQERLTQSHEELLAVGKWFDDVVKEAEEKDEYKSHNLLKPNLKKWEKLAEEAVHNNNITTTEVEEEELLNLATTSAFSHNPIPTDLQAQTTSLTTLRARIQKDISPGHIRDAYLTHLTTFSKLTRVLQHRDNAYYTTWLTETRNTNRRKRDLDAREKKWESAMVAVRGREEAVGDRERALENRAKGLDDFFRNAFEEQVGGFRTWAAKTREDLQKREVAVSRREVLTRFGCQIL